MIKKTLLPFIGFLLVICACDHGLSPVETISAGPTGIRGTIVYSNWSAADSIYNLRLVVFKNFPPSNILNEVSTGKATVYPGLTEDGLPFPVDSTGFLMDLESGTYAYVVVAQQYGPNVRADWRAVGQYDTSPADSLPTAITVMEGGLLENINITVDFAALPMQPF